MRRTYKITAVLIVLAMALSVSTVWTLTSLTGQRLQAILSPRGFISRMKTRRISLSQVMPIQNRCQAQQIPEVTACTSKTATIMRRGKDILTVLSSASIFLMIRAIHGQNPSKIRIVTLLSCKKTGPLQLNAGGLFIYLRKKKDICDIIYFMGKKI